MPDSSPDVATLPVAAPEILPASNPGPSPGSPVHSATIAHVSAAPPAINPSRQQTPAGSIAPSACGCASCAGAGSQFVYALGQLGYDLGSEARRDAFIQAMDEPAPGVTPNPFDPAQMLKHLQKNPWDAAAIIWTLNLDGTTIYAVTGEGPFAAEIYVRLRAFLDDHIELQASERVSIPGRISGKARLMNGQTVPVIVPELRGMYSWTTQGLVHAVVGAPLAANASAAEKDARAKKQQGLREFLDRIYFQLFNLGITAQDRAINFAGTNAFNIEKVYESAMKEEMDLDTIEVERSPICRPESDCWHVKLFFFFPDRQVQTVRKIYRFTVDVSDVVPVTVGPVRSWLRANKPSCFEISSRFPIKKGTVMRIPRQSQSVSRSLATSARETRGIAPSQPTLLGVPSGGPSLIGPCPDEFGVLNSIGTMRTFFPSSDFFKCMATGWVNCNTGACT